MQVIVAVLIIAFMIIAAHAQGRGKGQGPPQPDPGAAADARRNQEADKAYKATLDRIPNQPRPDPWGNVRPNPKVTPAQVQKKSQKN